MRKILLLTFSFLAITTVHAQDKLWLASGDTLTGTIDLLMPDKFYEEIVFENADGKKRMKAFEFVGFIKDGERYRSIKNVDVYQVMKLKKSGYLSLYNFRMDQGFNFSGLFALRADGIGQEVPNMGFKKRMSEFLSDCNAVSLGIKNGEFKKKDIELITDEYNACISQRTAEIEGKKQADTPATTPPVSESELLTEANGILAAVKSSGDEELSAMMEDVVDKLRNNASIPGYLKNAISDKVGEDNPLYARIQDLLKEL